MLPDPNTPPMTPPGISVSAANNSPFSCSNKLMQPEVDIDRHVRLVEHLAQHREVVAQHDLVGGKPVRDDEALAVEMIGCADMVEMLVAQHHHVDLLWRDPDMVKAGQKIR